MDDPDLRIEGWACGGTLDGDQLRRLRSEAIAPHEPLRFGAEHRRVSGLAHAAIPRRSEKMLRETWAALALDYASVAATLKNVAVVDFDQFATEWSGCVAVSVCDGTPDLPTGIYLNQSFFGRADADKYLALEQKRGFYGAGTGTIAGVLLHEFGHHLHWHLHRDDAANEQLMDTVIRAIGLEWPPPQETDDLAAGLALGLAQAARVSELLATEVGEYGSTFVGESVAEAYAEHRLRRDKASAVAREVGRVIDSRLLDRRRP
jgi:hypothetical protein